MNKPTVDIAVTTWATSWHRVVYLCQTIDALRKNLRTSHKTRWTCRAEQAHGKHSDFAEEVDEICQLADVALTWRTAAADLYASLNEVFAESAADYVLLCQDDRPLVRSLDLDASITLLERYPRIAAVWYDWLPPGNSSWGKIGKFWLSSPTSTWLIADREMLVRGNFTQRYGRWAEGLPHGDAEMQMNRRLKRFGATVAHPPNVYFSHVGDVRSVEKQ
jgi:hypothetical protein